MLKLGQVFNNRYKIISTLGEGGFGAVYKVWDDNLQRHCAIKENLQVSAESQKQFKREAIMLANLNHPHLVRVTDYFIISNQGQYLVMDFVDGDDLHTILAKSDAPLPVDQSLIWIRQICDALIYIHGQNPPIIHRDIKPANIRITPQQKAVLVDFGLAKEFDDSVKTTMGARGLTPHFAAPEQYKVSGAGTDAQSDIYSLGVTLYCLLTLRVPPESLMIMLGEAELPKPIKEINHIVPDAVSDAVQNAMQIRRTDRCKSVSDFKDALEGKIKTPAQVKATPVWANSTKISVSNGIEFIHIPAGKFVMGDKDKKHTVNIPYEYWTARFPITNEQYNNYAKFKGLAHPVEDWEEKKDHPVYKVTWYEAMDYCAWLNNLLKAELPFGMMVCLPTEAEWEKAARGADGRQYPWGNTFDKNKCNSVENKNYRTTPVALYSPHGDSPYGCSDMVGNISEWTHSISKGYPYNAKDGREDEKSDFTRSTRGGSYFEPTRFLSCTSNLFPQYPNSRNGSDGFRVAVCPIEERQSFSQSADSIEIAIPQSMRDYIDKMDASEALDNKGNSFYKLGHYEEALSYYDKALEIRPDNVTALYNKGICLNRLNRYEEAIRCCDTALKIEPHNVHVLYNKGRSLSNLAQYEEAIPYYDKTLEIDPRNTMAIYSKGVCLERLGDYEEAGYCYDKVLEIDPRHVNALYNKGVYLTNLGSYEEAISYYDKTLEVDQRNVMSLNNKGFCLNNLERYEEAIRCCNKALEIDSRHIGVLQNKGNSFYNLQRYEESIYFYDKVLEIEPRNVDTLINKCVSLKNLGRYEEAIRRCCDQALEIDPRNVTALYQKGSNLEKLSLYEEAIRYYDKALELAPRNISIERARQRVKDLEGK